MGAFEGLRNYFNLPLQEYAASLGYDRSNILILEGDETKLQQEYPQIYANLTSCRHHSDRRSPIQYGQDLVASWIFEDFFLKSMENNAFTIVLSGADRTRTILANKRTSTSSDYVLTSSNGVQLKMELVNDYTGFWYKNHKLHLRDNKYVQLQRSQSLLLAIALTADIQKYTVFDFRANIPAKYIESHRPYGYKPAYELAIPREMLYDFTFENVKEKLLSIL